MAAAAPFDITIGEGPTLNVNSQLMAGDMHWVSVGPGLGNINIQELQRYLTAGKNVFIRHNSGGIILTADLNTFSNSHLSLVANNIGSHAVITAPNLNLTLITPGTVSGFGQSSIGGLILDVGACNINTPRIPANDVVVAGITDGSNIVFANTKIEPNTHFFNGMDLSYVLAQKVANTASTASTETTSTTPVQPSMTAAFNTAAAKNLSKTDADQDPSKSPKAKK